MMDFPQLARLLPELRHESESGQVDQMDIYGKGDVSSDETGLPGVSSLAPGLHAASAPAMNRLVTETMCGTSTHERLSKGSGAARE